MPYRSMWVDCPRHDCDGEVSITWNRTEEGVWVDIDDAKHHRCEEDEYTDNEWDEIFRLAREQEQDMR